MTDDINISDIRLRKDAVLQTAKQIFINTLPGWLATSPAARMALPEVIKVMLEGAEAWHTAQEEYINKEE